MSLYSFFYSYYLLCRRLSIKKKGLVCVSGTLDVNLLKGLSRFFPSSLPFGSLASTSCVLLMFTEGWLTMREAVSLSICMFCLETFHVGHHVFMCFRVLLLTVMKSIACLMQTNFVACSCVGVGFIIWSDVSMKHDKWGDYFDYSIPTETNGLALYLDPFEE